MEPSQQGVPAPLTGDAALIREAWTARPYARTFDLISSQYGWTDDQILDLTMTRFRQIRDVIWERVKEDERRDLRVRETELRVLASYVAASMGNKEGLKDVDKIHLVPREVGPDGKPKKVVREIPYALAKQWFGI